MFVVVIAGILTTMAYPSFREYTNQRNLINARSTLATAAARARAAAVQRGDVVLLWVRPEADSIMVLSPDGADTLLAADLVRGDIQADIVGTSSLIVCYVPRGFAHPSCGDGESLPDTIGFTRMGKTLDASINAVGQVEDL